MKTHPSYGSTPVQRGVIDPRSTTVPASQTRKTVLNDRRSTR